MPVHEFTCHRGHRFERLFLTFGAVDEQVFNDVVQLDRSGNELGRGRAVICTECERDGVLDVFAFMRHSVPSQAHLLGNPDGYYKPSPTKRHSYKHVNAHGNGAKEKR